MNTPADPLREALEAAIFVLEKVRVFVTSREQINAPTGVKWFDEEVELCRTALAAKPAALEECTACGAAVVSQSWPGGGK